MKEVGKVEPKLNTTPNYCLRDLPNLLTSIRKLAIGDKDRKEAARAIVRIAKEHRAVFQPHPIRTESWRRQTEQQGTRLLEPALSGQINVVPWLDNPFVEPNSQS